MSRPQIEVADVIREYGSAFLDRYGTGLTPDQRRVLHDLPRCRTAALGGHVEACDTCGHCQIAYNSCRNRHCPKCRATAAARWLSARVEELLRVPYFHVVFTLPRVLNPLALSHPKVVYDLLFRAAARTLLRVAADPKHLGAEIGIMAVLHTWGQNLQLHPHLHCVVTGGGLSPDGTHFVRCRPDFFLPVRVLSRVFRGRFLHELRRACDRGRLTLDDRRGDAARVRRLLRQAARKEWVVYAKPPFGGPVAVLKYLARYTHRVAISNRRLLALKENRVVFRWKDYAHGNRQQVMSLDALEFLRRFLLHVLPSGFVRIRHYGLLANRGRRLKLKQCQDLLAKHPPDEVSIQPDLVTGVRRVLERVSECCPACGVGRMVTVAHWSRFEAGPKTEFEQPIVAVAICDSS